MHQILIPQTAVSTPFVYTHLHLLPTPRTPAPTPTSSVWASDGIAHELDGGIGLDLEALAGLLVQRAVDLGEAEVHVPLSERGSSLLEDRSQLLAVATPRGIKLDQPAAAAVVGDAFEVLVG